MLEFYALIQGFHNPFWDGFFILLSFLGNVPIYIILFAILFWNVDKRFGFRLGILLLFSMTVNSWLKDFFHFARPIGQEGIRSLYLSSAGGYAFPSGHSQAAATFYPYLLTRWKSLRWRIFAAFMVLGIGFSRLYLGVHWPGDVLSGLTLGLIIVFGFIHIDQRLFKIPFPLIQKLTISLVLPLLALLFYHTTQGFQLVGFIIGYTSGYFLEDTYLDYQERTHFLPSLYKLLLGTASLLIWLLLCRPLTDLSIAFNLPVYFLAGFWTSFGAPYFFRKFGWENNAQRAAEQ